jgi:putative hydrolase of the HAD superfamily
MNIKFVYFDAGGVLFRFRDGLREMAEKHDLKYGDFERVFREHDEKVIKGFISPQDLWEIYQRELKFSEPDLDYLNYWTSKTSPILESHDLLAEIQNQGVAAGLITNLYSGVYEQCLSNGSIPDLDYDVLVKSCDLHLMKPEEEIYRYAETEADVDPENILFVDDKADFLEPARERGWNVYRFDEYDVLRSVGEIRKLVLS